MTHLHICQINCGVAQWLHYTISDSFSIPEDASTKRETYDGAALDRDLEASTLDLSPLEIWR